MSGDLDALLRRIATALDDDGPREPPVAPAPVPTTTDSQRCFVDAATGAGARVHEVTIDRLGSVFEAIAEEHDARTLRTELELDELRGAARGVEERLEPPTDARARFDLGIAVADAGLADYGTVVRHARPDRSRTIVLLAETLVVVLPVGRLRTGLESAWKDVHPGPASATMLITGPSKTADIEGVLVTGAHGPATLHVILLLDLPAEQDSR